MTFHTRGRSGAWAAGTGRGARSRKGRGVPGCRCLGGRWAFQRRRKRADENCGYVTAGKRSAGMGRRAFIAGSAAVGATLGAPSLGRAQAAQPNVLMITIDDLNDWIRPLGGYPLVGTPNITRLANLGRLYRNAMSCVPGCSPSRTTTLFGMHPTTHGVYTNEEEWQLNPFLADFASLPRQFRDGGYLTVGTGKVFHRHKESAIAGIDPAAWDEYQFCGGDDECTIPVAGDSEPPRVDGRAIELSQYARAAPGIDNFDFGPFYKLAQVPDVVRAKWMAETVLSVSHDRPFFAACGIVKPHLPFIVPKRFFDLYPLEAIVYPPGVVDPAKNTRENNPDVADLGATGRRINRFYGDHRRLIESGEWKAAVQAYLAAISFADHCVGILLNALLKGPNQSDTIVVLWSDHGWQLGEKLAWRKFTLWERALRVPFIVAGPGIGPGGETMPVSLIDVYPTLCDLALGAVPAHLQGVSLKSNLLQGARRARHVLSTWSEPVALSNSGPHFSVRNASHRYIRYRSGEAELYDRRVDPYEIDNLLFAGEPIRPADRQIAQAMAAFIPPGPHAPRRGSVVAATEARVDERLVRRRLRAEDSTTRWP
jgi:arylsulfatase A-like enzyme